MGEPKETGVEDDPFDFARFTRAQKPIYDTALAEIKRGEKVSHWMWFIFPQIAGWGSSTTFKFYALQSLEEVRHYLQHRVLGARLRECVEAVLAVEGRTVREIFDKPDDAKLNSSMTLFALVAEPDSVFGRVLEKYFQGKQEVKTLGLLGLPEREAGGRGE